MRKQERLRRVPQALVWSLSSDAVRPKACPAHHQLEEASGRLMLASDSSPLQ